MASLFAYSLASSLMLVVPFFVYKRMMARERQFKLNRAALLFIYAFSLLAFPLASSLTGSAEKDVISMPVDMDMADTMEMMMADTQRVEIDDDAISDVSPSFIPAVTRVMLWLYFGGVWCVAALSILSLVRIVSIVGRGEKVEYEGFTLVLTESSRVAPFSFGRYVVMSREDYDTHGEMILLHEWCHVSLWHWVDLLLAQGVCILQWYNPAAWLMRDELKTIHEYQADRAVIESGADARQYQLLLVSKAVGGQMRSWVNSLNHSKLSKRVEMMCGSRAQSRHRLHYSLALIPALVLAFMLTEIPAVADVLEAATEASLTDIEAEQEVTPSEVTVGVTVSSDDTMDAKRVEPEKREEKTIDLRSNVEELPEIYVVAYNGALNRPEDNVDEDERVYDVVETKPVFPGGDRELFNYVTRNVGYPYEAYRDSIQGRVVVQFVVGKDGKVSQPKVLRGVHDALDAEAVRVVSSLPDFEPGKIGGRPVAVKYVIPISFKLTDKYQSRWNIPKPDGNLEVAIERPHNQPESFITTVRLKSDDPMAKVRNARITRTTMDSKFEYNGTIDRTYIDGEAADEVTYIVDGDVVESIRDINPRYIKSIDVQKGKFSPTVIITLKEEYRTLDIS